MIPIRRRLYQSQPGFSPRQLFSALQGAWLEPTPGYIWQENTGVTPTTTGGQTIGKIADQSGWGNNATQATAANRPLFGVRRNMLTYTEDFSNAVWPAVLGSGSITANAGIAPDGTLTADRLTFTGRAIRQQNIPAVFGLTYTFSVWLKAASASPGTMPIYIYRDNPNGVAATLSVTPTASWQRYEVTMTHSFADTTLQAGINISTFDAYVWGAQFENSSTANLYQRVTTATDYDAGRFPAIRHADSTDVLVAAMPDLGGGVFSSAGSVYFATPVGMSALHNQSMGTTYTLPALSSDIYSWIVVPQRLSTVLENRLEQYMLRKASLTEPDYLLDDDGNQLMSDNYELLLRQ